MTVNKQGTYTTMQEGYYNSSTHQQNHDVGTCYQGEPTVFYHRLKNFSFCNW